MSFPKGGLSIQTNALQTKRILEFQRRPFCQKKGFILKGHRPLTLSDLHTQMLQIILQGHLGVEKCQLKATDCIFWLGISKDIMNMTANCPTCIQFLKNQQKELLHPHNVPSFPWQKVGTDLFDYQEGQYSPITDYYREYPIIESLPQPHLLSSIISSWYLQRMVYQKP